MKRKLLLVLTGLVLILTLAFSSVSAAKPAISPGGVGAAGPLWHWRYQSGTTASNSSYWMDLALMDDIQVATAGRMYVDCLPTGSLCTSYETMDATMTGAVECANS